MNKKFFSVGVLALIVLLFGAFFVITRNSGPVNPQDEDAPELPVERRPFVTLTPTEDGHYLTLEITNVDVPGTSMLEYLLTYDTTENGPQGTSGRIMLVEGKGVLKNEILLGSESSGKFRYDEGVETGSVTLKFRDDTGKLVFKSLVDFRLLSETTELSTLDGLFTYELDDSSSDYFVVMNTLGLPAMIDGSVAGSPYGVFSSGGVDFPGTVSMSGNIYMWDGADWNKMDSKTSDLLGVFVSK